MLYLFYFLYLLYLHGTQHKLEVPILLLWNNWQNPGQTGYWNPVRAPLPLSGKHQLVQDYVGRDDVEAHSCDSKPQKLWNEILSLVWRRESLTLILHCKRHSTHVWIRILFRNRHWLGTWGTHNRRLGPVHDVSTSWERNYRCLKATTTRTWPVTSWDVWQTLSSSNNKLS